MLAVLGNHLWQSTLFAIAAGLLTLIFRTDGARVRHGLWLAASLKFLVPFSLLMILGSRFATHTAPLGSAAESDAPAWSVFMEQVAQPLSSTAQSAVVTLAPPARAKLLFNVTAVAVAIWLCGIAVVLCVLLLRWRRINAALRTAQPFTGQLQPDFPIEVRSSTTLMEPGVIGIFRPVLLLPQGISERLQPEQLQAILVHELCHVRRRDNLTGVLHLIVESVFWFHPLVWWIGTRILEEREYACDEAVLESGSNRIAYAEGLLQVCELYLSSPLVCAAGVSGASLKRRVANIMHSQVALKLSVAKKALLTTVAAFAATVPVVIGVFRAPAVRAQAPAPSSAAATSAAINIKLASADIGPVFYDGMVVGVGGTFDRFRLLELIERNESLKFLIAYAYDLHESQIIGPADTLSVLYSMDGPTTGSPDHSEVPLNEDQRTTLLRTTLQGVLTDRFGLVSHWETRRAPVYAVVGGGNSGIKQAATGDSRLGMSGDETSLTVHGEPFGEFVGFLAQHLDRPTVDQTGLTARYNFTVRWTTALSRIGSVAAEQSMAEDVRKQLGLQIVPEDAAVKFLVIDHIAQPTNLIPPPQVVTIAASVFDRYVGHYAFPSNPSNRIMTVSRDGDHFTTQLNGAPQVEIFATSEREFFSKFNEDITYRFATNDEGAATQLILHHQHPQAADITAPRMSDAAAKAQEEALALRVREQKVAPGSEAALRKYIHALQANQPDDDDIDPIVAATLQSNWADAHQQLVGAGQLQSVAFRRVGPLGPDVYWVQFEKATYIMRISLDSAGKIGGFDFRQLPASY
jgi:bla regulator protein BlaR1